MIDVLTRQSRTDGLDRLNDVSNGFYLSLTASTIAKSYGMSTVSRKLEYRFFT
jgi:hypothetical protein